MFLLWFGFAIGVYVGAFVTAQTALGYVRQLQQQPNQTKLPDG
jgi:hypothetical protein